MARASNTQRAEGFTLVELLLGLAISGMLLAALAAAFNASVVNYQENREAYEAVNNARLALFRMTTQLRTAGWEDPNGVIVAVTPDDPDDPNAASRCSFYTSSGEDITYEFRSPDRTLYLITNADGQESVLCGNVTAATFAKTPTPDGEDCNGVQISLSVESNGQTRTFSSSVAVRRKL